MDNVVSLFEDDDFYFFTSYPKYVSIEELKYFLLKANQTFKVISDHELIGLVVILPFSQENVYFKLKFKHGLESNSNLYLLTLQKLISFIKSKLPNVKKIFTNFYEFEQEANAFFQRTSFNYEFIKKKETFHQNRFWDMIQYSLFEEEISLFSNDQDLKFT